MLSVEEIGKSTERMVMTRNIILAALILGAWSSGTAGAPEPGGSMSQPDNLIDFSENGAISWQVVNDGVMGGRSSSDIQRSDQGTGIFTGNLSLENNGGFASVRALIGSHDLSSFDGLEIRVRGDGRTYQLRLRTEGGFDGIAYRTVFESRQMEWVVIRLPFTDFLPSFRGRTLADAPPLDTGRVTQVAFMLADKRAGEFFLEIDFVRPWTTPSHNKQGTR